ncbi:hypothetical protein L6452_27909 [Arctium lappa]|uniref:Uncharacterized protein n=1 Tax=Arctium lappa TaxID=4217 RepID=A0ACB8ZYC9_ARCLA|nr:hypothetical protein L6452_27909 [Arctium lappa]
MRTGRAHETVRESVENARAVRPSLWKTHGPYAVLGVVQSLAEISQFGLILCKPRFFSLFFSFNLQVKEYTLVSLGSAISPRSTDSGFIAEDSKCLAHNSDLWSTLCYTTLLGKMVLLSPFKSFGPKRPGCGEMLSLRTKPL